MQLELISKIRKEFQKIHCSDWEGEFGQYFNGDYVNEAQQDRYEYFASGYMAALQLMGDK